MGMFGKLARVLGGRDSHATVPRPSRPVEVAPPPELNARSEDDMVASEDNEPRLGLEHEPVVTVSTEEIEDVEDQRVPTPRNKQELMAELQRNYTEMVSLIRKVDQHLDAQDSRSKRMLEIAERMPEALDALPALREQTGELTAAVNRLTDVTASGHARADEHLERQTQTLSEVRDLAARSGEIEQQVSEMLSSFDDTLENVSGSTDRLGVVLQKMQERDEHRDTQLAQAISQNQKWMTTVLVLCLTSVGTAVVLALVVLLA